MENSYQILSIRRKNTYDKLIEKKKRTTMLKTYTVRDNQDVTM
jgi:hypothetical protein